MGLVCASFFFFVPMIGRNVAGSILKQPQKYLPLVIVDLIGCFRKKLDKKIFYNNLKFG